MISTKEKIINEIKKIYDPEIPVNIYELGLIYRIEVIKENKAIIEMTLTSPNCPVAESLPNSVKENILKIDEILESCVVSLPDECEGEKLFLFIASKNKKLDEIIRKKIMSVFGSFAIPSKIFYVSELPKTRSGKILRR